MVIFGRFFIEIVALGHAGQAIAHLPGDAVSAHHQVGEDRERVDRADAVVFPHAGTAGDSRATVDVDGADTTIARSAAIAEGQVRHRRCLCLEQDVEDHWFFGGLAERVVVLYNLALAIAVELYFDLHAARFSAIAASSDPGSISGAAPTGLPMMAW